MTIKINRLFILFAISLTALALVGLGLAALTPPAAAAAPAAPEGGASVIRLSVGSSHACAAMSTGRLLCWGVNANGQVGDGTTAARYMPVDVVNVPAGATEVAAGGTLSCAIVSGGVKCWGANGFGQLGTGNNSSSSVPTDVVGLTSGAAGIAAGVNYACAVTTGGAARCWGTNDSGQLGTGNIANSNVPTDAVGLSSGVQALAARQNHTCAIVSGGVRCWGANFSGQLGTGNLGNSLIPTDVVGLPGGSNVTALGAGAEHTCAAVNGAARCWGSNVHGQLGTGNTANSSVPTDVVGLTSGIVSVATGASHACALTSGGGVKCWGRNDVGQLGISSTQSISAPVDVLGLTSGVAAIAAGGNGAGNSTTCALMTSGGVKCWGAASALGVGGSVPNALTPRDVLGLPDFCLFNLSYSENWSDPRNWGNCSGGIPQTGADAVIGRPASSGVVPQIYATATATLNRLHLIGSFTVHGPITASHLSNSNPANINLNNYGLGFASTGRLTITQAMTWSLGTASSGTAAVTILPGAVANFISAAPGTINSFDAHLRNYGTLNLSDAQMGRQWTNEAGGVMNFNGGVTAGSGGTFTNRGVINTQGVNRLVPVTQHSGALNVSGVITRTSNFIILTMYGGALNGTGIISDAVYNVGGVVAPGGPGAAGSLTIGDWYYQSPTATLHIDIGGSITGTFDQLNLSNTGEQSFYPGRVDLSGTLTINQLGGFIPASGAEIRFMNFNVRGGWFSPINNAFDPAFVPGAFSTYAALIEGTGAAVKLYASADSPFAQPGDSNGYSIRVENPFTQAITLQAITHTLPVSFTYTPGSASGGAGDPAISLVNGRQQLSWSLASAVPGTSQHTFHFGVAITTAAPAGTYSSTVTARTSAGGQELSVPSAAPVSVQWPTTSGSTFSGLGSVSTRPDGPPMVSVPRGSQSTPFLIRTLIECPINRTCTSPGTDIVSVSLKIAGYPAVPMTPGEPPTLPLASTARNLDIDAPAAPSWANPPPHHRWEPGVPCDQQLPSQYCDPGPGNPYRTPLCPVPIVVIVVWWDGSVTEEVISCMALYDPSGYVRNLFTSQPITNATVSLYRMPFALPDTSTQTRDCRTIDTRPGGPGGDWNSLPPASLAQGVLEDWTLTPARIDPAVNPQMTDDQGHYGWNVAAGCWFVAVSAPGYLTKISPAVGVPPEVTDLDVYLVPDFPNKLYLPLVRR